MLHNCIFHNLFNKILPNKPTGSVIPNRGNLKELFLGEAMGDSPIWSEHDVKGRKKKCGKCRVSMMTILAF